MACEILDKGSFGYVQLNIFTNRHSIALTSSRDKDQTSSVFTITFVFVCCLVITTCLGTLQTCKAGVKVYVRCCPLGGDGAGKLMGSGGKAGDSVGQRSKGRGRR